MDSYFFIEVVCDGTVHEFGPYLSLEEAATLVMEHIDILVFTEEPLVAKIHEKYYVNEWIHLRTPFTEERTGS